MTMPNAPHAPYDVAITGFGPAGAVAAALLGQAGLRVWVGERLAEVHAIPRAIALDHEILRVFQQLGLSEAIAPHIEPFTPSEFFGVEGQLIRRMTMVEPPYPQGYTPSVVFTQPPVEQALRARVAQMPSVAVALSTEVRALHQDTEGVTLSITAADGQEAVVRARWAIACDGGASGLRGQLGIDLIDLDFDEPWLVVDVLCNARGLAKLPTTSVQYCEPERPCTYVIGPGHHRRWEISLKDGEDPKDAATPEQTWALLSRWLTPEDGTLWRQSSYRFHALVADRWRVGRAFVAGDAAHMQPPFLGQGMCQGVRDVVNLCWKLTAVLRGEVQGAAAERLLDSYGAERQAHVRELTTRIKAVGTVVCERDPVKARARDARLLAECGGVVKDTPRQDVLPRLERGDGGQDGLGLLAATDSPGRGTLFPQPWLRGADGTPVRMDHRFGSGWRLVLAEGTPAPAQTGPSAMARIALGRDGLAETEGVLARWFAARQCSAALVRPDHYVFGTATGAAALDALLREAAEALGQAPPAAFTLAPDGLAAALRRLGDGFSLPEVKALYEPLLAAQPRDGVAVTPDLSYGPHTRHRLDLYRPEGDAPAGGWPVLVVVHGGGFIRGDKSQRANFGWHFARQGIAVVVPNYRLAPESQWPSGPEDVAAVCTWIGEQAAGQRLDAQAVVLLGESAGAAHVAAAVLMRRFLAAVAVRPVGAVLLSGPYHPQMEALARTPFGIATPDPRNDAYFGTDDPVRLAAMSIAEQIDADPLPLLIGHAERDLPQMQAQAGDLFTRLVTRHGGRPEWLVVRDHNHFSQCTAVGTGDETLAGPLLAFVRRCGVRAA
ncbi:MAG: hypothetical protein RL654_2915 [Pseudomonadota bacterium]|jgi:3-(3-hydroxy-phenyl)propionate hydroxylase